MQSSNGGKERTIQQTPAHRSRKAKLECVSQKVAHGKPPQEAFGRSEVRYRQLFECVGDAVMVYGSDGRFLDCNKLTLERLGYSYDEFLNLSAADIVHPDFHATMRDNQKKIWAGQATVVESAHGCKDGRVVPVEVNARRIEYDGQQAILAVVRDITKRKRAEEARRLSEEKFAKAFNSSPAAIFITTLKEGRFIDLNEIAIGVFGYTREEVVGHTAKELNMWANYNDRDIVVQSIRRGNAVCDMEARFRRKSGELFDGIISVDIINIGGMECFISTIVDITERKKAEERVKTERQRLYDVLETLPVMVCLLTPDYHVTFANRVSRQKFGEDNGRYCYDYIFGRKGPYEFCEAYNVLKTGKPHHWECTGPDGCSIIDVYDFLFTDTDGSPLILEMDIDITERKRAEEAVRSSENKYRTLLENLPQKIFLKDKNSVYISCNENYSGDLKITARDIAGKTDYDFYPKELAEKYRVDDKRIMEEDKTEEFEEEYPQEGEKRWVYTVMNLSPLSRPKSEIS